MDTKIPKFRRCVIQNFPFIEEDFDALTDYGLVSKIVKYLNDVIDQTNTTTENMQALQTAFNTLKNYVDHYFDNLDVQEEINNKLDDMAESGQLADIISQYLNSTAIFGYDNVASMKAAENLVDGSYAHTLGYHSKNDGGAALYKIRNITNDDVVDEMFIIEMGDGSDNLVAELITNGVYIPEQVGAKNDSSTDAASVFSAIFAKMQDNEKLQMAGKYLIGSPLYLPNANNIVISGGELKATSTFNGYILNSNTTAKTNPSGYSSNGENITIENVFIDGNYKADGIYVNECLRTKIKGCTIHNPKTCGINIVNGHETQVIDTNIVGRAYGYDDTEVISTGIIVNGFDNIINNCVVAYCQWAVEVLKKFNQICNCHFYCNRNGGGNIKLNGTSYTSIVNNYLDGSGIDIINPWQVNISDNLFEVADTTNHIIKLEVATGANMRGVYINNSLVEDVRTNKPDIEFIECNRRALVTTDNYIGDVNLPEHIKLSNPYNNLAIKNSTSPVIIPDSYFRATVNNSTGAMGTPGAITDIYNMSSAGNYIETEFIGASTNYAWAFCKIVVPQKCRIRNDIIEETSGQGNIAIYDSSYNFINFGSATIEAGTYYVGIYRNAKMFISNL